MFLPWTVRYQRLSRNDFSFDLLQGSTLTTSLFRYHCPYKGTSRFQCDRYRLNYVCTSRKVLWLINTVKDSFISHQILPFAISPQFFFFFFFSRGKVFEQQRYLAVAIVYQLHGPDQSIYFELTRPVPTEKSPPVVIYRVASSDLSTATRLNGNFAEKSSVFVVSQRSNFRSALSVQTSSDYGESSRIGRNGIDRLNEHSFVHESFGCWITGLWSIELSGLYLIF